MMTQDEFEKLYRFLKSRYGIDMSHKQKIMEGRMENYLNSKGFHSYSEYIRVLESDFTGQLEKDLVNIMSTNHTYFMREFEHFQFLKDIVLPYLKQTCSLTRDLCIWCGAASTGQEPYMIAMLLQEFFGLEAAKWDKQLLATDISTDALSQAKKGIYTADEIKTLPEHWKRLYFKQIANTDHYEVSDSIKSQIIFRSFNLMMPFPFKRKMHVIFLRNVMIYFDQKTKQELSRKIYQIMEPGGYLFIGRTETLERGHQFELIQPSIYRKPLKPDRKEERL